MPLPDTHCECCHPLEQCPACDGRLARTRLAADKAAREREGRALIGGYRGFLVLVGTIILVVGAIVGVLVWRAWHALPGLVTAICVIAGMVWFSLRMTDPFSDPDEDEAPSAAPDDSLLPAGRDARGDSKAAAPRDGRGDFSGPGGPDKTHPATPTAAASHDRPLVSLKQGEYATRL